MRPVWTSVLTIVTCAVPTTLLAGLPRQAPPQEVPQPRPLDQRQLEEVGRMSPNDAQPFIQHFFERLRPRSLDSDKEIAGLPPGSRPELLRWERVYTLALVRARAGTVPNTDLLGPKVLAELAAQHRAADFDRFRHDFLAARPGAARGFSDPSALYLELLRRLQVVGNASYDVALREICLRLYQELLRGESSGLSNLEVDLVDASLASARQRFADAIAQYRDGLDEFKVAIGLAPRALWIPDPETIAPFRAASDRAHNWHRAPNRTLGVLHKFSAQLPALGEVTLDGQPILGTIEANPGRLEEVLATATRMAATNRKSDETGEPAPDADAQLELRTRRHIRHLAQTRQAYEVEKRRFELATRLIDQLLTQFAAPPAGGTNALAQAVGARIHTQSLLEQFTQIGRAQDHLIGLWSSFKAERLTLYHDLGVFPYNDWKSFYDDLGATLH
jgi:hypothetical protein